MKSSGRCSVVAAACHRWTPVKVDRNRLLDMKTRSISHNFSFNDSSSYFQQQNMKILFQRFFSQNFKSSSSSTLEEGFNESEYNCLKNIYESKASEEEFKRKEHLQPEPLRTYLLNTSLYPVEGYQIADLMEEALQQGNYQKTVDIFTSFANESSRNIRCYELVVDALIELKDFKLAEMICLKGASKFYLQRNNPIFIQLLRIYCVTDQVEKLDALYKQLTDSGFMDRFKQYAVLKSFADRSDLNSMERFFGKITNPSEQILQLMLTPYVNNDLGVEKVEEIFKKFSQPNTKIYNIVMDYFVNKGSYTKAEEIYRSIKEPDTHSHNIILKAYTQIQDTLKLARHVQQHPPDIYTYNTLLTKYAKLGDISTVENIFNMMKDRSFDTYNIMLMAYNKAGRNDKALEFYQTKIPSSIQDGYSYATLMKIIAEEYDAEAVQHIYQSIEKPNVIHKNILMNTLAKQGKMKEVEELFNSIQNPDEYSINSLLKAFINGKDFERAEICFKELKNPATSTCNIMLKEYKKRKMTDKIRTIFHSMQKPNNQTYTLILSALPPSEAMTLLKQIPNPNDLHIRAIMGNFANSGDVDMVIQIFEKLVNPQPESYAILLSALTKGLNKDNVAEMLPIIDHYYQQMPDKTYLAAVNCVLKGYAVAGDFATVENILSQMPEVSIISENCLLRAYKEADMYEKAYHFYMNEMKTVDSVSFVLLMACYYKSEQSRPSTLLVEELFAKIAEPNAIAYNSLMEYYCQDNTLSSYYKVLKLFKKIPDPDRTSLSLLKKANEAIAKLEAK
ncbi:hypothetical protein FDP41_007457 [Naegleria fowleri]|uniref:Pentacotripeptide-repeat region of PRORP domain-containing protein n=1 Tax=Naegleria fowleri TaxID=5763 RepID=A0A6A5CFE0_NAEFO|nr:uncharacterized protein FDP41_007457 [Naegleria fowleri]KAF0984280.1 hypothetical protein FDP41_007457 [Naegleria fowleri]